MKNIIFVLLAVVCTTLSFTQKGFIENKGQIADFKGGLHSEILFSYQSNGLNLYFKKEGLSYYFYKNEEAENDINDNDSPVDIENHKHAPKPIKTYYYRVDMLFKGSNKDDVTIKASKINEEISNFYYSHCNDGILNVNSYKTITYSNIYNNIDFVFNITPTGIKYDVIIKPDANPNDIQLLYDGVTSLEKISGTEVLIKTPIINFTETIPLSFYSNTKEKVNCEFLLEDNTIKFEVPNYNNTELVIDPVQNWSTFLDYGSTNVNSGRPVFDSKGNMYNASRTQATGFPLINAGGGQYFDNTVSGTYELVLYKFGQNDNIVWSTYYGGSGSDNIAWPGRALAIDSNEHIYILVNTIGSTFPTQNPGAGAFYQDQSRLYGFYNAALIELDTNGVRQWATVISHESANTNSQDFTVWGISAKNNNVYITGIAGESSGNTIPFRSYPGGYYNTTMVGDVTPFIARFTNRVLDWCTYVNAGSGAVDYSGQGWDVEEDNNGNIYMTGMTGVGSASPGHLLTNPGGGAYYQNSSTGSYEVILTKFGTNLQPIWSSYYGGVSLDDCENMTLNDKGELFIVGYTNSSDFPTYNPGGGAYYRASNAMNNYKNSYIVKFDNNNALDWATTYSDSMIFHGIETDANGKIYVYGVSEGGGTNTPTLSKPGSYFDNSHNGGYFDYYITQFDSSGIYEWGTFYGGSDYDGFGISGRSGLNIFSNPCTGTNIVFFGQTRSANFPTINPGGGALYQSTRTSIGSNYSPVIVRFVESGVSLIDTNTTNTSSICETGTKTLTATIGAGTWSVISGGGTIVGTIYTPANVTSNTSVTIRYTDACGNISDKTFTVNVSEIANNTMSTNYLCTGGSRALTGTPVGGTWTELGAGTLVPGSYIPPSLLPGGSVGVSTIYTIAANGACSSNSDTVDFLVVRDSTVSAISSVADMCNGDTRLLVGIPAGGVWSIVSGPGTISNDSLTATGSGTIQLKYRVVGQCNTDSVAQTITVSSSIAVAITSSAASFCEDLTRTLTGTPGGGSWTVLSGPATESGGVLTPNGSGTVRIEYAVTSSCGNGADTVDIVINPTPNASAGLNENICLGDTITLTATGGGTYQWVPGPATAMNQVFPTVTTGYRVDVTSDSGCLANDSVTVFVQTTGIATAQNDQGIVTTGVQESIDLYTNDVGGIATLQIVSGPSNGNGTISGGNVLYNSTAGYIGNDTIQYEICDGNCQTICDTAYLFITIENDLTIPIGISINGDGKNDVFNILGLSKYPNNSLKVFNRWGSLVFQAEPYLNDWAGQSINGEVIEGTYFYVLELGEELPSYNGYIELKK